jgi:PAS domain S-box-containing protein
MNQGIDAAGGPAGGFAGALFTITPLTAALVLAAGLALAGIAAAILILRDHMRVEARARRLEAELEALQDKLWRAEEGEHFFRTLAESQLDALVQRDAAGRITYANAGYARLLGARPGDLVGRSAGPRVVESRAARSGPDGARLVDEAVETPDGVRWFAWIETQTRGRGGAVETLRAGREITDRIGAEAALAEARARAEAASEAKSRFLATVSHEFRTPLGGILGMADLILDTQCDPEQATYAQAIKTSGGALLSLIDEILDFSRIEAGKLTLAPAPFDLGACVEGVVELLAPRAQGKGIEIAAFVAADLPPLLVGDADRIRQILVNLAGNAVKFTESGGVGVEAWSDPEGGIVLRVSDTGPGIARERVPGLFEEFEQGDGSAARRHPGTGLGLAITQRLVAGMGGTIAVDSAPGDGARFTVTLPLPAAEERSAALQDAPGPAALAGQRILVLGRSPFEAPFIARRLAEAGAQASLVDNEAEALAKIAMAAEGGDAYDALLVDCALGDDLARDVAAAAREAGVPRSIVLVSPFERRDLGSPTAAGYDGYLVKPVRGRSLVQRLVEPLGPRPSPAATRAESAAQPALRRLPGERGNAPRSGAPRVLLAEDNEINALLALKALEKRGAVVDWAKDGHEAVALAEASFAGVRPDYDVVLMDIRMPGLDGLEATRRIRTLERALGRRRPRRIVALTANVLKEDEEAARSAGLDGFIPKPLEPRMLDGLLGAGTQGALAHAS